MEKFLTQQDVAERYKVTRISIWRWCKEGRLPQPVIVGGVKRWRLSDLEAWEKQREAQQ